MDLATSNQVYQFRYKRGQNNQNWVKIYTKRGEKKYRVRKKDTLGFHQLKKCVNKKALTIAK
jgi:hypothetical protein